MADLKENHPLGFENKEIEDLVNQYAVEIFERRANPNAILQFSPLIQLEHNELQGRQTQSATRLSVGVSILSLLIAGMAVYVSLAAFLSSERWKEEQLEMLSQVQKATLNANNTLINALRVEMEKNRTEISISVSDSSTKI